MSGLLPRGGAQSTTGGPLIGSSLTVSGSGQVSGSLDVGGELFAGTLTVGAILGATLVATATTNQVILGTTKTTTLNAPAPAGASQAVTVPDSGKASSSFLLKDTASGAQSVSGSLAVGTALSLPATNLALTAGVVNIGGTNALHAYDGSGALSNTFAGPNAASGGVMTAASVNNVGAGTYALAALISGHDNTALGYRAGFTNSLGNSHTAVGSQALANIGGGSSTIAIGAGAGSNYIGTESNNILLASAGVVSENGNIRIGTTGTHTAATIAGAVSVPDTTQSTSTTTGAAIVSGGLGVAKAAFIGGTCGVAGVASVTNTTQSTSTATGALVVSGGVGVAKDTFLGGNLNLPAPVAALTAGVYKVNGQTFMHCYDQPATYTNTLAGYQSGTSAASYTSAAIANTGFGYQSLASLTSGSLNTCVGYKAGNTITTSAGNTALGCNALLTAADAHDNTAVGTNSLIVGTTAACNTNTAVGSRTLDMVVTGSGNLALGYLSGRGYTGAESNNILLGNQGVLGESGQIRIGTGGTHTAATIAGRVYGLLGFNPGAYVYLYAPQQQTFTANVITKADFTAASTKIATAGITISGTTDLKVPVAGIYDLSASIFFSGFPATGTPNSVWFVRATDAAVYGINYNDNPASALTSASAKVYLAANDSFSVQFLSTTTTTTVAGSASTYVSAVLSVAG